MENPFDYGSKRVVVTGGATGVGDALVHLLAELGEPEVTVLDLVRPTGPHATFIPTDLADKSAVEEAIIGIEGRVDVLFNNAGVAATQAPAVVLAVNYLALRALSEGLLGQIPPGGVIVNTASIAGDRWPSHIEAIDELIDIGDWNRSLGWVESHVRSGGMVEDSYGFSKEVIRVWGMRHSRTTIASGVRTNSVCPAPVATPLLADFEATMGKGVLDWTVAQGTGSMMTARDVAMPLAFIGSAAAAYVNGHDLIIDGGFNAALATGQLDFDSFPPS
jgi:NAD(P)-dependent dehydrogenase (short-subunit alcohol dehydrogenase family)